MFRRQLSFYRLKRSAVDALERTFQHFLDKVGSDPLDECYVQLTSPHMHLPSIIIVAIMMFMVALVLVVVLMVVVLLLLDCLLACSSCPCSQDTSGTAA
jgi:ABC-type transport system involved in cytochrome bd biosynthesis fused ATPase/permease subunit